MRQLKPKVYAVGAIDFDVRLFDRLIPLPDGINYNSYLIKGSQKTALLDTVDPELLADDKAYRQFLYPGDSPVATFDVKADSVTAREHCNVHGLWKGD